MPKTKQARFTTPRGEAVWPHLNTPDRKFVGEGDPGIFKTDLRVKTEDVQDLLEKLEMQRDDWADMERVDSRAPLPWKEELDEDGQPTGYTVMRFKQKEWIVSNGEKIPMRIKLLDSQREHIDAVVGKGSTIRIAFNARGWKGTAGYGITLHPYAVQVIDLIEAAPSEISDFEVEEGGFVASDHDGDF